MPVAFVPPQALWVWLCCVCGRCVSDTPGPKQAKPRPCLCTVVLGALGLFLWSVPWPGGPRPHPLCCGIGLLCSSWQMCPMCRQGHPFSRVGRMDGACCLPWPSLAAACRGILCGGGGS